MSKSTVAKKVEKEVAPKQEAAAAPVQILRVKGGQKYRGARASWYERLAKYDGKPATQFLADVEKDRPSNYGARSKHAGTPEPVSGWLRFFVRTGVCTLEQPKA